MVVHEVNLLLESPTRNNAWMSGKFGSIPIQEVIVVFKGGDWIGHRYSFLYKTKKWKPKPGLDYLPSSNIEAQQ